MKSKTIKCGSRRITISAGPPTQRLAWLRLDDLGTGASFAMSPETCRKVRDAMAELCTTMDQRAAERDGEGDR